MTNSRRHNWSAPLSRALADPPEVLAGLGVAAHKSSVRHETGPAGVVATRFAPRRYFLALGLPYRFALSALTRAGESACVRSEQGRVRSSARELADPTMPAVIVVAEVDAGRSRIFHRYSPRRQRRAGPASERRDDERPSVARALAYLDLMWLFSVGAPRRRPLHRSRRSSCHRQELHWCRDRSSEASPSP